MTEDSIEPILPEGRYLARLDSVEHVSKDNSVEVYFSVSGHIDYVAHRRIDPSTPEGASELVDIITFLENRCRDVTISRKIYIDVVHEERRCPFYEKSIWINKVSNMPFYYG